MESCAAAACPPITTGWSLLILWTITVYGVVGLASVFVACVHWQSPSAIGTRILRGLGVANAVGVALAPVLIAGVFDAPRLAVCVMAGALALAITCRAVARRLPIHATPPPAARVVR